MQLKRLQGLEREKLEAEYEGARKAHRILPRAAGERRVLKGVLKDELIAIRDKYGDDRLTEIQDVEDEIDIEDLIEEGQCVFTLSTRATASACLPRPTAAEARRPRRDRHDDEGGGFRRGRLYRLHA